MNFAHKLRARPRKSLALISSGSLVRNLVPRPLGRRDRDPRLVARGGGGVVVGGATIIFTITGVRRYAGMRYGNGIILNCGLKTYFRLGELNPLN